MVTEYISCHRRSRSSLPSQCFEWEKCWCQPIWFRETWLRVGLERRGGRGHTDNWASWMRYVGQHLISSIQQLTLHTATSSHSHMLQLGFPAQRKQTPWWLAAVTALSSLSGCRVQGRHRSHGYKLAQHKGRKWVWEVLAAASLGAGAGCHHQG